MTPDENGKKHKNSRLLFGCFYFAIDTIPKNWYNEFMQNEIDIRTATPADAEKIRALYAPYVQKTAISFEYETPSIEEFAKRIEHILPDHPWLVAESGNGIAGYAYAEKLYARPAYARAAETSVYVKEDCRRGGVGRKLYESMENILKRQFVTNLYACIAYRETEDSTLTRASVDFHRAMGYRFAGKFERCGFKFGQWYDVVWMEKIIGEHDGAQFVPFSSLPE